MDDWSFNVSGDDLEDLLDALKLGIKISGHKIKGWKFDIEKGLILSWNESTSTAFPEALTAEDIFPIIKQFLIGEKAKEIMDNYKYHNQSDFNYFDGSIKNGWRVYTEKYGRIDSDSYSFIAIQPIYLFISK